MKILKIAALAALLPMLAACRNSAVNGGSVTHAAEVRDGFMADAGAFESSLAELAAAVRGNRDGARAALVKARLAYKRIEFLAESHAAGTARGINGPATDEVEDDDPTHSIVRPEGLQVIGVMLYNSTTWPNDSLATEIAILRANAARLRTAGTIGALTDQVIFDAMRIEVVRIIALGQAGFDAPIAERSIPEAAAALEGMRDAFGRYRADLAARAPGLAAHADSLFTAAIGYLHTHPDFAAFDHLAFIRAYANPLARALLGAAGALGISVPDIRRPFAAGVATVFDTGAFDPYFYAPPYAWARNRDREELGKLLFFDPILSGNGDRACASCHRPELAFTDGRGRSIAFGNHGAVARNAPTMINAGLQRGAFFDERVAFLEDQVAAVVGNPIEMHGSLDSAVKSLASSPDYAGRFRKAFAADGVSERTIRMAIAGYIRSLTKLDSPFDRYIRGESTELAEPAKRGFNLFMGKARCGTCHFMPLFNGTVPPMYTETETEVIGVPVLFDTVHPRLDPDLGRFAVRHVSLDRFAFKTPTLRNIELTAPYMHNGAFATLEQVLDFYNRGGGAGLGLDVPGQTLSPEPLGLTQAEMQDIIAFLKSLTDTAGLTARPAQLPLIAGAHARTVGGRY